MEITNKILSDITVFNKYAKYIPELKRRETWDEICDRYENMMCMKYPALAAEIVANVVYIRQKRYYPL